MNPNQDDAPDAPDAAAAPGEVSPSISPTAAPALDTASPEHAALEKVATHPLGTAAGAVGGAVAGAVIGIAAGPVGSLAGAVGGAIAGGLLGSGVVGGVSAPGPTDLLASHDTEAEDAGPDAPARTPPPPSGPG